MKLPETDQNIARDTMAHELAWDTVNREFVHDPHTGQWYRKGEKPAAVVEHKGLLGRLRNMF